MRQFVADHRAGRAEIRRPITAAIVEGRLQNAGREVDVVFRRLVIRVHRRRRHQPLRAVHAFADLVDGAAEIERVRALRVPERVSPDDLKLAVVAPLVRIANLVSDCAQLAARLLACVVAHPRERRDVLAQGGFNRRDHGERVGFGLGAERFCDIRFAERLAEVAIGVFDAAFPPWTQLRSAAQRGAVEAEVLVHKCGRQHRRVRAKQLPAQVVAMSAMGVDDHNSSSAFRYCGCVTLTMANDGARWP
jgi:hypothetical protein